MPSPSPQGPQETRKDTIGETEPAQSLDDSSIFSDEDTGTQGIETDKRSEPSRNLCGLVTCVSPLSDEEKFYEENALWKELMGGMHTLIDYHLIRLLDINGFRTYYALKDLDDQDLSGIEDFVKTGGLETVVGGNEADWQVYLGPFKDPKKFRFMPGEKKLLKRVVEYVNKHHIQAEKPLGKMNIYSMFKKHKPDNCDSPTTKRNKTVVSSDIPSEVSSIRRLVKDYFKKNGFSKSYLDLMDSLFITVKTTEKEGDASLSAYFECPICSSGKPISGGYRERKSTWLLSNFNRHFQNHKKKNDKLPGTVDNNFFQSVLKKNSSNDLELNPQPVQPETNSNDEDDDLETIDSGSEHTNQQQHTQSSPPEPGNDDSFTHTPKKSAQKYSRTERRKRSLGRHIEGQTRLPVYYPILNEIEIVLKANKEMISALQARCEELSLKVQCHDQNFDVSNLLQMLMNSAIKNSGRKNHGQRYEDNIKLFAAYLFIVGGRALYEMLLANLTNSLPSISVVERTLKNNSSPVIEGVFRFQELKEFLIAHDLPMKVCISEDGTRVQQNFSYDPTTNQIIGPVLPLADNGVPISGSFPATSPAMITNHFQSGTVASSGYAIMAQPLQKGAPSFCLTLFGTDNRFTSEHCLKRWNYIYEELEKIGIEAVAFSSDGDPKLLSGMHSQMFNPDGEFFENVKDWYFAAKGLKFTVIQDPIHTANKFKTRLSPSNFLPIGNYSASQTHLRQLIQNQGKDKHGLSESDLDKEDKMNFNASMKISSERVTDLMQATVPGSEATVAYLTNMRYLIEACMDESLSPSEVLYKIWHCTNFLRFWKLWLLNHPTFKMEQFVTPNLYLSVEVIAHALTILIIKFREGTPELFLVSLFSSQACEMFFRLARCMTTTQSTVINFNMKEFLSKVRRVDLLHYITSQLSGKLVFPREKRKKLLGILTQEKLQRSYMPTDAEICEIVLQAKSDALSVLRGLGVIFSHNTSLLRIRSYLLSSKQFEESDSDEVRNSNYQSTIDEDDIPLDLIAAFPSPVDIPSLEPTSESLPVPNVEALPHDSIFLMVPQTAGGFVKMRKSTFCWLLAAVGPKLSSDRLQRVRQNICFSFQISRNVASNIEVEHKAEVEVGDWCIFKKTSRYYITQVLDFTYLSGSGSSRKYTLPKAPTKPPKDVKKVRGLGCLCTWYSFDKTGKLSQHEFKVQGYVNMTQYIATVPPPSCVDSVLQVSSSSLSYLQKL